jgi:hypothetical protein
MVGSDGSIDDEEVDVDGDPRPTPIYPLRSRRLPLSESPGLAGIGPILSQPTKSTPLDSDSDPSDIPSGPLWAMKYLRHRQLQSSINEQIRWASTDGDPGTAAYVIDDGDDHCMLSRIVGSGPDATYQLVERVKRLDFEDVRAGWAELADLWEKGREITLCAVAQGAISNVIRVATYRRFDSVPNEYLPPSDLITFDESL